MSGRRAGTVEDFRNLVKLSQAFDVLHTLGGAVEPQDSPGARASFRDDARVAAVVRQGAVPLLRAAPQQIADCLELIRIANG